MRRFPVVLVALLPACGSEAVPARSPATAPSAPQAVVPAAPAAPTEIGDADIRRWLAVHEQVLDRAGIPGTDPDHRKRHQAVREEVLKQHGTDMMSQAQLTVRINSALDLLRKRAPIPESMRSTCAAVERHRAAIEAYLAREQRATMR